MSFIFGDLIFSSKSFNKNYQALEIKNQDLDKILVSEALISNKIDKRIIIGYEISPWTVIPLNIKTPKKCFSHGLSQYNENSPWKMGFNVEGHFDWINQYKKVLKRIEQLIDHPLTGNPINKDAYINPKLLMWDGECKTMFNGKLIDNLQKIPPCEATGVLKMSSIYKSGENYHLQVFLKECKYDACVNDFQSQISDNEDDGFDTVY